MNAPRNAPLPTRWQQVAHAGLLVGGWLLFGLAWWDVLQQQQHTRNLWLLLVAAGLLVPTVTLLWVRHNQALYRRLGPRRAAHVAPQRYVVDFNGHPIDADWQAVSRAADVSIELVGGRKRYRVAQRTVRRQREAELES